MTNLPNVLNLKPNRLLAELNAIRAIVIKQWLHTVRYPTWVLQLLIWPLIFPAAYILTARAFAGPEQIALPVFNAATGTDNYIGYIVIGTLVWMWQNIVLWNVGLSLREEQLRGTLESNWLTPVWRFSLLIGSILVQTVTIFFFIAVTFLEYRFLFQIHFQGNIGLVILAFAVAFPSIYGIGITFASLVLRIKEANSLVHFVRGFVMIFCGITFPISVLPGWMKSVSQWLPQTYVIRAIREITLVGADFNMVKQDLLILLGFGFIWMVIGYFAFTFMDRLSRRSGSIGQY
ncbi:MAG: ABC transporter permease [Anaerolineaceae bacterium]